VVQSAIVMNHDTVIGPPRPTCLSNGCIVQCLCLSLVFVLHFLQCWYWIWLCFNDQCIQSVLERQL